MGLSWIAWSRQPAMKMSASDATASCPTRQFFQGSVLTARLEVICPVIRWGNFYVVPQRPLPGVAGKSFVQAFSLSATPNEAPQALGRVPLGRSDDVALGTQTDDARWPWWFRASVAAQRTGVANASLEAATRGSDGGSASPGISAQMTDFRNAGLGNRLQQGAANVESRGIQFSGF
jgi:hypothetical protein